MSLRFRSVMDSREWKFRMSRMSCPILRDPDDVNADIVDRLFTEDPNTTSSITTRLVRDSRDYILFPTRGVYDLIGLEVAGLGGDNNFTKLSGTFDRFFKLREKMVLAFRGHAALPTPLETLRIFLSRIGTSWVAPIASVVFVLAGFHLSELSNEGSVILTAPR